MSEAASAEATPSGRAYLRLVAIGALIGIPAALLVGRAGLDTIPAAVLAVAAAWITVSALEQRAAAAGDVRR
jgi:hypothetical protein